MSAYKKNNKYYVKGTIVRDDGSKYSYTKIAKNCCGLKEAKEYERLFRLNWQDIKVSLGQISFIELSERFHS